MILKGINPQVAQIEIRNKFNSMHTIGFSIIEDGGGSGYIWLDFNQVRSLRDHLSLVMAKYTAENSLEKE